MGSLTGITSPSPQIGLLTTHSITHCRGWAFPQFGSTPIQGKAATVFYQGCPLRHYSRPDPTLDLAGALGHPGSRRSCIPFRRQNICHCWVGPTRPSENYHSPRRVSRVFGGCQGYLAVCRGCISRPTLHVNSYQVGPITAAWNAQSPQKDCQCILLSANNGGLRGPTASYIISFKGCERTERIGLGEWESDRNPIAGLGGQAFSSRGG